MDPETDPPASVANMEESAHKVQGIAKTGMRTSHGDDVGQHPQRELAHCKLSGPSGHAEERFPESPRLGLAKSCSQASGMEEVDSLETAVKPCWQGLRDPYGRWCERTAEQSSASYSIIRQFRRTP